MNKHDIKLQQKELRIILNKWGFIGFNEVMPEDEYDCLRDSILSILHKDGTNKVSLKNTIKEELSGHFGMPEIEDKEIDGQVDKIWVWWLTKQH